MALRSVLVLVAVLAAASSARADEYAGLRIEADELSRQVLDAWIARENTAGIEESMAEAEITVSSGGMAFGCTATFHPPWSKVVCRPGAPPGLAASLKPGLWFVDLMTSRFGWRGYLASGRLTGRIEDGRVVIDVGGENRVMRRMEFDAEGRLERVALAVAGPGGKETSRVVRLGYRPLDGKEVLTELSTQGSVPGLGEVTENTSIHYAGERGQHLLPVRIDVETRAQGRRTQVRMDLTGWRLGYREAGLDPDESARWVLEDWERRAVELRRLGVATASCRFEIVGPGNEALARGTYRFDGQACEALFDDEAMAQEYGHIPWAEDLDRVFQPYFLRRQAFAGRALARRAGGNEVVLEVSSPFVGAPDEEEVVGLTTLTFDARGRWTGGTRSEEGTQATFRVRYEPWRHEGATLERPVSWQEESEVYGVRSGSLTYTEIDGLAFPATLVRERAQGGERRRCTLRFSDWAYAVEARARFP